MALAQLAQTYPDLEMEVIIVDDGNAVPFNLSTVQSSGTNISMNSSGVFTLKSGKTYNLIGNNSYISFSSAGGYFSTQWRNITGNVLIGSGAYTWSNSATASRSTNVISNAVITPTTDITVRLEVTSQNSVATIGDPAYGLIYAYIEET